MPDDFAHYAHEFLALYFPETRRPFYTRDGGFERNVYAFLIEKYSYLDITLELVKRVQWSVRMLMRVDA